MQSEDYKSYFDFFRRFPTSSRTVDKDTFFSQLNIFFTRKLCSCSPQTFPSFKCTIKQPSSSAYSWQAREQHQVEDSASRPCPACSQGCFPARCLLHPPAVAVVGCWVCRSRRQGAPRISKSDDRRPTWRDTFADAGNHLGIASSGCRICPVGRFHLDRRCKELKSIVQV